MSSDLPRLLANLIRYGTVKSVTTSPARVQVQTGGLLTKPLRWVSLRAGARVRHWSPPSVGEQVLVFSPNGDTASGVVLAGIPCDAYPIPEGATADNVIMAFGDGAVFLYDTLTHLLRGVLPEGGRVELQAPAGFLLTGDVEVDGNLTVTKNVDVQHDVHAAGTVTGDTDVVFASISSKGHAHDKTQPGSGVSGKPVAA